MARCRSRFLSLKCSFRIPVFKLVLLCHRLLTSFLCKLLCTQVVEISRRERKVYNCWNSRNCARTNKHEAAKVYAFDCIIAFWNIFMLKINECPRYWYSKDVGKNKIMDQVTWSSLLDKLVWIWYILNNLTVTKTTRAMSPVSFLFHCGLITLILVDTSMVNAMNYCARNTFTDWKVKSFMQFTKEKINQEYAVDGQFKALHCCAKGYRSIEWWVSLEWSA